MFDFRLESESLLTALTCSNYSSWGEMEPKNFFFFVSLKLRKDHLLPKLLNLSRCYEFAHSQAMRTEISFQNLNEKEKGNFSGSISTKNFSLNKPWFVSEPLLTALTFPNYSFWVKWTQKFLFSFFR